MFSQRKTVELMKKVQIWEKWLVQISEIGPNSERLVRMPNDWSEFRTIGPNADRLVRISNDWSEFWTIGPNSERLTSLTSVFSKTEKSAESVELLCCSDVEVLVCKAIWKCSSVDGRKKSAWTDLDQVDFEKNLQCPNVQIEKSAWTGLGKGKKRPLQRQVFFNFLQDWSPGGRRSVLHFDGLTLTRGAVVATPFAAAFSLTFSLVKN